MQRDHAAVAPAPTNQQAISLAQAMRITIVTPAAASSRTGNRHTAARYAAFLRAAGHQVRVVVTWEGQPCDLLIALHARRSRDSIVAYRERYPQGPLIVVLTGTDIYRDIHQNADARHSLKLADQLIVLQERALDELQPDERRIANVVYQSAATRLDHAPVARRFRVAVIGHLRDEKDPFRALHALQYSREPRLEVVHVGDALDPQMKREAQAAMTREPRYRWIGGRSHGATLKQLAGSHLLVVSSRMEGGANVICEAGRIGVPVLASDIPGNVGMLGKAYPGYYPLGDAQALAGLIHRAHTEPAFYRALRQHVAKRRALFAPAAESAGLRAVVRSAFAVARRGAARGKR